MLWKPFLERCDFYLNKGVVPAEARAQAGLDVLKRQATRTIIPRFAETFIREVWEMQTRLLNPKPQQIEALAGHARFRAGFDFLLLREKSGDSSTEGMGVWWEAYQEMSIGQKEVAIRQYNRQRSKTRRKTVEVDEPKTLRLSLWSMPLSLEAAVPRKNVLEQMNHLAVSLKKRLPFQDKSMQIIRSLSVSVYNVISAKWFLDRRNDYSYLYRFRQ